MEIDHSMWKQYYNACLQTDDTSDKTEVSATANVWLILCAFLVCMLFSTKLLMDNCYSCTGSFTLT